MSVPCSTAVTLSDGKEAGQEVTTNQVYVTPGYFDTLQIPVLAGRAFTDADSPDAQHVVVVNQTFARKFFHGANPVGRYLNKNMLIVGVVGDTVAVLRLQIERRHGPFNERGDNLSPRCTIVDAKFLSMMHTWFQPSWIVRTAGPVEGLTGQMQRALASADPNLPFSGFYYMKDLMAETLATQRVEVALLAAMAIARAIAERGRYLRAGGEHGSAEDARDRHPHCPGLDDSKGDDPYRQVGSGRFGSGIGSGTGPVRGRAARHAERTLRRRRVRCADFGNRRPWDDPGHHACHHRSCSEKREDRSGHNVKGRISSYDVLSGVNSDQGMTSQVAEKR